MLIVPNQLDPKHKNAFSDFGQGRCGVVWAHRFLSSETLSFLAPRFLSSETHVNATTSTNVVPNRLGNLQNRIGQIAFLCETVSCYDFREKLNLDKGCLSLARSSSNEMTMEC